MELDTFRPTDADLDGEIEGLVAKRVRGELTEEEEIRLSRLVTRRSVDMRPVRRSLSRQVRFV